MFGNFVRRHASQRPPRVVACTCTPARRSRLCAYCGDGSGYDQICGQCKAAGIDGGVIRGTSARRNPRCPVHGKARRILRK